MRRRILDDRKKSEICAILAVGGTRTLAARYVGCCRTTIFREAKRAPEFRARLAHAEASHEVLQLKNLNTAAQDIRHWRAAAWILERKYPRRWAARGPTTVTPEQVAAILERFADIVTADVTPAATRQQMFQRLVRLGKRLRLEAPAPAAVKSTLGDGSETDRDDAADGE